MLKLVHTEKKHPNVPLFILCTPDCRWTLKIETFLSYSA
jgi:hypothetical protein